MPSSNQLGARGCPKSMTFKNNESKQIKIKIVIFQSGEKRFDKSTELLFFLLVKSTSECIINESLH